ncbi:MAG: hypothetical protein HY337_02870 [Gemmatimonadetes bacterium]|nr:hypothetical protein [Gemmatimonadota bacterium]
MPVVLQVASLTADTPAEQDALATWLLGHTERIAFGEPYRENGRILVEAVIRVDCRYLDGMTAGRQNGMNGRGGMSGMGVQCLAHGFQGQLPEQSAPPAVPSLGQGNERTFLVQGGRRQQVELRPVPPPPRSLPVLHGGNPCVGAPCRTADNKQGAACCRDLTIDVVLDRRQPDLVALLRSRKSPYLYKVRPNGNDAVECEIISSCGYLEADDITCSLHDRVRPDGEPAKPFVCSEWPDPDDDSPGHPGCRLR